MKKIFLMTVLTFASHAFAQEGQYECYGGPYKVDLKLTQDKSTYIHLSERYQTLAIGYAKFVDMNDSKTTFNFYPQMGPIDLIIKTQDVVGLPKELNALLRHQSPFFSIREMLDCTRR